MQSDNTSAPQNVIIGYGDIGQRVAALLPTEQALITMSRTQLPSLPSHGTFYRLDLDEIPEQLPPIKSGCDIYYFVPPLAFGQQDIRASHLLHAMDRHNILPRRFIVISTSGVYGNRDGELVSEQDAPSPQVDRARRRLDMEKQFTNWCSRHGSALIILRVGGVYGPGRLPLRRIKDKVPVLIESLAPKTNRIHADDLAQVCVAAAKVNYKQRIYNVSDGQESNMTEYFNTIADYFKLERPPQVDWEEAEKTISAGMLSYLRESRRMDNQRMLKELDIELLYPDLQSGLKSCDVNE